MSVDPGTRDEHAGDGVARLLSRAAAADARARARLKATIDDVFLPDDARLDDRARAAVQATLAALVATVEGELREHGARLLRARGNGGLADVLSAAAPGVLDRLIAAGLPRDADFMRELVARVRQQLLAELLPAVAPEDSERPSLLPRLIDHADRVVAASAMAVLIADNRRHARGEEPATQTDLPAELHHRLVWWVAAALREREAGRADIAELDRALAEAALRNLAAHDEGERLEAVAMRLAGALDAHADELPDLLIEALGDRRVAVFIAVAAHALGISYDAGRAVVLDPDGDRLWLALRALGLGRDAIARVGLLLSEGDPQRDIDALAAALDDIAALDPDSARAALAPLRLHPDYLSAVAALRGGGG